MELKPDQMNKSSSVRTNPAKANQIPFLKMLVLGRNIQKEEITKKKRDTPKNTFRKKSGSPVLALCRWVSFSMALGRDFT